jgi:hypothetical protein
MAERRWTPDRRTALTPAWQRARARTRRRYLLVRDGDHGPEPPAEAALSDPCEVGEVILVRPALSTHRLVVRWRITARTPVPGPYAARLTVTPASLADLQARRVYP